MTRTLVMFGTNGQRAEIAMELPQETPLAAAVYIDDGNGEGHWLHGVCRGVQGAVVGPWEYVRVEIGTQTQ